MAFVDELTIKTSAGNGGDGVVRWRHERGKALSGPSGGNGGRGGDVYAIGVRDIGILSQQRYQKEFNAENGETGKKNSMHGKDGEDFYIKLPVGSVITNTATNKKEQLLTEGETIFLLRGGHGGYGNEHFKSSTNTTPKESTPGKAGERGVFFVELELVVDAGFIGLPNAGKSSLLNALTNARAQVGSYQFTTLDPNLGDFYGFILADIPGLIEGASEGRGLGHKFLRHIKRTKLLIHCISFERDAILDTYKTIRNEIEAYDTDLAKKKEIVVLTKTDVVSPEEVQKGLKKMKKVNSDVFSVSIIDDESIKEFQKALTGVLKDEN